MCKKLAIFPIFGLIIVFIFPKQALASYPGSDAGSLTFALKENVKIQDGFLKQEARLPIIESKQPIPVVCPENRACRTYTVVVTGYSSTVDQCDADPFTTASMTTVHRGTLAANSLSFGTEVMFPDYFGDRVFIVEDRMAKRFSNRMDIWFETRSEALKFGKRKLKVMVLSD